MAFQAPKEVKTQEKANIESARSSEKPEPSFSKFSLLPKILPIDRRPAIHPDEAKEPAFAAQSFPDTHALSQPLTACSFYANAYGDYGNFDTQGALKEPLIQDPLQAFLNYPTSSEDPVGSITEAPVIKSIQQAEGPEVIEAGDSRVMSLA